MSTQISQELDKLFIGGAWVASVDGQPVDVIDPSSEEQIGCYASAGPADADAAVAAARRAFDDPGGWSSWSPEDRAAALERLADAIERRAEDTAVMVSRQNGMPITLSRALEAEFPKALLRYYAELARTTPTSSVRAGLLGGSLEVRRMPYGVVAAIVPWNYPQTIAAMKYAPALAAGCTIVLKPSPETALDSAILAECVLEADLPAGVINIVVGGADIGAQLVSHPDVDKVSFTGSTAVGRGIAATCGELLRPVTLELGGKSAAIVLDDAQLAESLEDLFGAVFLNNGQTCFVNSRVLAPRSRYDEVVEFLGQLARGATVGDPLDESTMIGPLVSARQRDRVEGYVQAGRDDGGRLVAGGTRPERAGWFVEPTVFADVTNDQRIAREEIFGPVLAVIPYDGESDAIAIANDSAYGLGGTVWSADPERAAAVARRVHTGTIGVNGYLPDPVGPFGGVKASGLGRELATEGLDNYVEPQTIYLG